MYVNKEDGGLGFRDIEAFNEALLAKQSSRLIQNESSLLFTLLKAKCFPYADIMDVTLGPKPSFTWQSILGVKNTIL